MPPKSKSKDKKEKEGMTKTNRRKPQKSNNVTSEGQTPGDLIETLKNSKNKPVMYEHLKAQAAHQADGFLKNLELNRLPVPINERRRVKIDKDEEFYPGQYCKMENSEYTLLQAPSKASLKLIWKLITQDQTKIIVCLCHDEQISATEDSKCFPWFPTEVNQSLEVEQKKGKYTIVCKAKEGLSMGAVKYDLELSDSETVQETNTDDPNGPGPKTLVMTLYHMNAWSGTRPESGNPLELAQNVALFLKEINKAETNVLRKSMENFVPPVIIQSFDAIGRSAIAWVVLMLLKDVEKRECFDVPDLIKKLMKLRPGAISSYYHYVFTMAVALHIGKEMKWCEPDCEKALADLTAKFPERKLNEVGNLIIDTK
ncbi:unnamed protein product [Caenorhabditis sp. 36 PRJEB53466]|nr:unnamed protein product [Caenorhabditis sp. 36 PRJEB53466]